VGTLDAEALEGQHMDERSSLCSVTGRSSLIWECEAGSRQSYFPVYRKSPRTKHPESMRVHRVLAPVPPWALATRWALEVPFPNNDQRNTRESLSKAKRKVLLLQKGAATDHSLIEHTWWEVHPDYIPDIQSLVPREDWSMLGFITLHS
jgi:hypothetical protein